MQDILSLKLFDFKREIYKYILVSFVISNDEIIPLKKKKKLKKNGLNREQPDCIIYVSTNPMSSSRKRKKYISRRDKSYI